MVTYRKYYRPPDDELVLLETRTLRRNQFLLNLHTGQSLTQRTIPDAVLIQFNLLMMSTALLETCMLRRNQLLLNLHT